MATPDAQKVKTVTATSHGLAEGWGTVRHYRLEGGLHVIDITARNVAQLFSGLDPAPFRHKDLDPEVEGYIVAAVREIGDAAKTKLVIHIPADEMASPAGQGLPDAIHNYFAYREWVGSEDLKRLMRTALVSLLIGLAFMFVCMSLREWVLTGKDGVSEILDEGLLIVGWVALWRPLDIALYDWWPLWRSVRHNRALKSIPVDVRALQTS
ncbi:MAG: hypothetical protein JNM81_13495 [Rhodospirillaceae bacterium]|nr:hypothetical protein [Rhodospirillaceae bacterium]